VGGISLGFLQMDFICGGLAAGVFLAVEGLGFALGVGAGLAGGGSSM